MKLHFYGQVICNQKLADRTSLPLTEQERLLRHQQYLTQLLHSLSGCRGKEESLPVLFEIRGGKIRYSVFVCCGAHGYEIEQLLQRCRAPLDSLVVRKERPFGSLEPSPQGIPLPDKSLLWPFWRACYRLQRRFLAWRGLLSGQLGKTGL